MSTAIKKKMNLMFKLFLFFYVIIGFYLSINTGISTDEFIDQYNWKLNLDAIKDFFGFNDYGYKNLLSYEWKYHGVGFHYISQLYILVVGSFVKIENFSQAVSNVLINHSFIFLTFFLSALLARKILNLIINDKFFSNIFLIFYLFYPYLLGHGFYNPKDMPFLFAWLLSSYIGIKIFIQIYKNENISFLNIFLFALSTAFLFSIRISGIMIFLQYFITLIIIFNISNKSYFEIIKKYLGRSFLFASLTLIFTIFFYPLFWLNPLLLVDAINEMKNIQYGVCTLTLGACMDALNLPSSYLPIWLFFKLPLIILLGLIILPFIEKRIFSSHLRQILFGSLLLTIISILFLLIFLNVNLYDELRHNLFLIPIILIVSYATIYFFSKKVLLYASILSIFFFIAQNISMYPYQYTWFNLFSNFVDVNDNFELDYWGVSGRNVARKINNNEQILLNKDKCIYVAPKHIIEPFISDDYKCVKSFFSIYPKSTEKYTLVKFTRNIRRENPSNCNLIFEENYNLYIYTKELKMAEVYLCN
tara:strand:- start:13481 stop:15076 length:1596 start_codon:yes stop_codon:yes gene_type:complete